MTPDQRREWHNRSIRRVERDMLAFARLHGIKYTKSAKLFCVTHKTVRAKESYPSKTKCGKYSIYLGDDEGESYQWKNVTCEPCLEQRKI